MTLSLFLSIMGIAFVDSLNPSLFVAQFYLLTTPRPVGRIITYIAGILTINLGGGLLIFAGVRTLITEAIASLSASTLNLLQLGIGLVILAFGLWYKTAPQSTVEAKKPRSMHLIHAYVLGMVVMFNELTTALPYFVAIEQIAQAKLNPSLTIAAFISYNVVFSLPLFGFLGLFLIYRQHVTTYIERINRWMQKWVPRLVKLFSVGIGALLCLNAAAYFLI